MFFALTLIPLLFAANPNFTLDSAILAAAQERFGQDAKHRLLAWQNFIRTTELETDLEKLEAVNDFFNQFAFISDKRHWQKEDYWATPIEFIASNGGDCEDFALAKYFTLKKLGIKEERLNITYVKAWKIGQAHMVLTYYSTPDAEPLVLDNLIAAIEPASKRDDLLPVFSFNGSSLWIAKDRGHGNLIGKSDRLQRWNELLSRLPDSLK